MITYKEALELLKTEKPIYYKDIKKRKITGVIWRRDADSLFATVEVLDESRNCVSIVGLEDVSINEECSDSLDSSLAVIEVNKLMEELQNMKACIIYENEEKVKDSYNRLMRGAIKLDTEIRNLSDKIKNDKIIEMIDKNKDEEKFEYKDLDYETIEKESEAFNKRIEEFDEDSLKAENNL